MSISHPLSILLDAVPNALTLRDESSSEIIAYALFLSFVLFSITKLLKTDVFRSLIFANIKMRTLPQFVSENYPVLQLHTFIQLINYWLTFSILLFVLIESNWGLTTPTIFFIFVTPLAFLLISLLSIGLTNLLVGEPSVFRRMAYFKVFSAELLSILFFILGLLWILTPFNVNDLYDWLIIVLVFEFLLRTLKGLFYVLTERVSWYYIILYFCTLEILPLLIGFTIFKIEFQV
ncbi:MAG TPA: DUF4271 domain-containing protein [Crocinitomicaceae bacterium]|nr:DUF4271 domain-containing protein [Crocinitomicaceae bacterium]